MNKSLLTLLWQNPRVTSVPLLCLFNTSLAFKITYNIHTRFMHNNIHFTHIYHSLCHQATACVHSYMVIYIHLLHTPYQLFGRHIFHRSHIQQTYLMKPKNNFGKIIFTEIGRNVTKNVTKCCDNDSDKFANLSLLLSQHLVTFWMIIFKFKWYRMELVFHRVLSRLYFH